MKQLAFLLMFCGMPAHAAPLVPSRCDDAPMLAEPWTSWTQSGNVQAGGIASAAPRIILGKPVVATLRPAAQVQFPSAPGRDRVKGFGGLLTLAVRTPAHVGIALSEAAWVDILSGSTALPSMAREHGPDCSGIRKIIWFDLRPGLHTIQIAGAPSQKVRIMAADSRANQP